MQTRRSSSGMDGRCRRPVGCLERRGPAHRVLVLGGGLAGMMHGL